MRAVIQQGYQVGRVDLEILAAAAWRGAGGIAATVSGRQRPALAQPLESRPGRRGAGTTVDEQHDGPTAGAGHGDSGFVVHAGTTTRAQGTPAFPCGSRARREASTPAGLDAGRPPRRQSSTRAGLHAGRRTRDIPRGDILDARPMGPDRCPDNMWAMDRMAVSLYPSAQRRFLLSPGGPVRAGSPGARILRP